MKKVTGKRPYQDNSTANPQIEDAHGAVTACLETLLHNLIILFEKPVISSEVFQKASSKCVTEIYILQSSLDFEKGAYIAEKLFRQYEYVKFQIITMSKSYDEAILGNAVIVLIR